jgi:putative flavoprotein involved in K+ transport
MADGDDVCIVIGAGPAGLATAAMLGRAGVRAVVLERGQAPAASWRARYDRLRINTSAFTSFLPGMRLPVRLGRWPTRDQLVTYYERYARVRGLDIRTETSVERVDRDGGGWVVRSGRGDLRGRAVVVATGKDRVPLVPDWPGADAFAGRVLHAAYYRNAAPFEGRRVVVVGAGSSALDIVLDLMEGGAASVSLAVRTPPHLVRRSVGGVPADLIAVATHRLPRRAIDAAAEAIRRVSIGDLSAYGIAPPSDPFTSRVLDRGMIPTIDPGPFVTALKRRRITVVAPIERLEPAAALLADGTRLAVDDVVAATGYRRGLEPLVGHLGVLDPSGEPRSHAGADLPEAPGLHFVGFTDVLSGNLREIRLDARRTAAAIALAG